MKAKKIVILLVSASLAMGSAGAMTVPADPPAMDSEMTQAPEKKALQIPEVGAPQAPDKKELRSKIEEYRKRQHLELLSKAYREIREKFIQHFQHLREGVRKKSQS